MKIRRASGRLCATPHSRLISRSTVAMSIVAVTMMNAIDTPVSPAAFSVNSRMCVCTTALAVSGSMCLSRYPSSASSHCWKAGNRATNSSVTVASGTRPSSVVNARLPEARASPMCRVRTATRRTNATRPATAASSLMIAFSSRKGRPDYRTGAGGRSSVPRSM